MDIVDFLPKYPNINNNTMYDVLNPYDDDNFNYNIYRKKEFYENKLSRGEDFPSERGMLTNHQKTIARYLSSKTPYDRLLLVHSMGTGKTCSAIGAIEQIISEESTFNGAIILAKGDSILNNFKHQLVYKCTSGKYESFDIKDPTSSKEKTRKINKITKFYSMKTFITFTKEIEKYTDENLKQRFSNKIIVVDEVHNLRISNSKSKEDNKQNKKTYNTLHRLFHVVDNCKIIFLSGTPMKDNPVEIANVMNLLLPLSEQLETGDNFREKYMKNVDGVYVLDEKKSKVLRRRLKGYISFLREAQSNVSKVYYGVEHYQGLHHFKVEPLTMSDFQSEHYLKAYALDGNESDEKKSSGVYNNSTEASLFVYPDGSYGSIGFKKYINKNTVKNKKKLSRELESVISSVDDLKTYSSVYYDVISKIIQLKDKPGTCFIYCSVVQGSGCILLSLLLKKFGFSEATGNDTIKNNRFALLTTTSATSNYIKNITDRFNQKDNWSGEYIKIIIGSKAVSEGFSFNNVIYEAILTPHWNYSETAQALARGIRLGSHNGLIERDIPVSVHISQYVNIPVENGILLYDKSLNLYMYKISEIKDIAIKSILRMLMEISFDCALNYIRNKSINSQDGDRDCDYTKCDYKCEGIDMNILDVDIDYSTYNLYYSQTYMPQVYSDISKLYRGDSELSLNDIIEKLKDIYTDDDIINALYTLQKGSDPLELHTFLEYKNIYSRSSVDKISNIIESIFRNDFYISLTKIKKKIFKKFTDVTEFEIIVSLRELINNNVKIKNRYGLVSYLREDMNMYFLVNDISIIPDFLAVYYTINMNLIPSENNFNQVVDNYTYSTIIPKIITRVLKAKNLLIFGNLVKKLPKIIQEYIIEYTILAKIDNVSLSKSIQDIVLTYYKGYIRNVNEKWYSTFLLEDKNIKCTTVVNDKVVWVKCTDSDIRNLDTEVKQSKDDIYTNEYKLVGLVNPNNNKFCILDLLSEEKAIEKRKEKGGKSKDLRVKYTGKNCSSWTMIDLRKLLVFRLKINPTRPITKTKEEMISYLERIPEANEMCSDLKIQDEETLARLVYWIEKPKVPMCNSIREFLEEKELIIIDNQCGVKGKIKDTILNTISTEHQIGCNIVLYDIDSKIDDKIFTKKPVIESFPKNPIDDKTGIWICSSSLSSIPLVYINLEQDFTIKKILVYKYSEIKNTKKLNNVVKQMFEYANIFSAHVYNVNNIDIKLFNKLTEIFKITPVNDDFNVDCILYK